MRKIIAITHVTLDGIMQAPGGPEEDPRCGGAPLREHLVLARHCNCDGMPRGYSRTAHPVFSAGRE
jgi:hypothetical protein